MAKKISSAQASLFEITYDDTEIPSIGDWMLTPYGPGKVFEILEPRPIPERFLKMKQGQTHWYVDQRNLENHGVGMCNEEGYILTDLSIVVAVRYRPSTWNYFRLSQLTKWNGKHQYNEGPMK